MRVTVVHLECERLWFQGKTRGRLRKYGQRRVFDFGVHFLLSLGIFPTIFFQNGLYRHSEISFPASSFKLDKFQPFLRRKRRRGEKGIVGRVLYNGSICCITAALINKLLQFNGCIPNRRNPAANYMSKKHKIQRVSGECS